MEFKPLFFSDKLLIVNPYGTVGVVTLWSPLDKVFKRLREAGVDLNAESSNIAVLGNLYGEGFRYLLRNLLYNPQIDTIIVFGNALNNSEKYLPNFFNKGVEPFEGDVEYLTADERLKPKPCRIIGTDYVMDNLVLPGSFKTPPPTFIVKSYDDAGAKEIREFFEIYQPRSLQDERVQVEVPEVKVTCFPSNIRAHTIVEKKPSRAWKVLVHRIFRFGQRIQLQKGPRMELQNLKVVIEEPSFEDNEIIKGCGFDPNEFANYQKEIISSKPPHSAYSYGHRIRAYFGIDCLNEVVIKLKECLDDRRGYISLWDNKQDIQSSHSPCLVSLFFRKESKSLHLTATYRSHNAARAWLENFYGLMAIQNYVAERIGVSIGSITLISHSISLDPMYLEKIIPIHDQISDTPAYREDPNGYFRITIEGREIVVKHYSPDGFEIGEFRGKKPTKIQQRLYRDNAISDINHAIYIGRQVQKAFQCIQETIPYIQD